jgi:hypothetical protein
MPQKAYRSPLMFNESEMSANAIAFAAEDNRGGHNIAPLEMKYNITLDDVENVPPGAELPAGNDRPAAEEALTEVTGGTCATASTGIKFFGSGFAGKHPLDARPPLLAPIYVLPLIRVDLLSMSPSRSDTRCYHFGGFLAALEACARVCGLEMIALCVFTWVCV